MTFLPNRHVQVSPSLAVGFDPAGTPVAKSPNGQQADVVQVVVQYREQLVTQAALLTLWLREVEAQNESRIVVAPPGMRVG